jgi:macrolide-specific efflux system membrane fusion protein
VEAGVPHPAAAMRPGMTAGIEAVMESKKNVLKLPISGLFDDNGTHFVYLYVPGAAAEKVQVTTGLRNDTDVEILKGLSEGDQVYTDKPLNVQAPAPASPARQASSLTAKKGA